MIEDAVAKCRIAPAFSRLDELNQKITGAKKQLAMADSLKSSLYFGRSSMKKNIN